MWENIQLCRDGALNAVRIFLFGLLIELVAFHALELATAYKVE